MKKIICLLTILLGGLGSYCWLLVNRPPQMVSVPVVKMELDPKKVKSIEDFQEIFDSLQITYTYKHGDKQEENRLAKVKRFCK